ncbi:MAG: type III-A CRISPR-associated protein Csm2 [Bacteroidales bacterium]|nr:type III-A CRISPR-associated protein Csm2 [Lachnoclostridium sp.]MCM1383155.1 type III-A CRISPR-associated protein Csm2 [Lachnoclostridium sp.]MCM1464619.1 type III-A CRISPR-associated protein Csm2 [Bacteroidales bacterium]
MQINEQNYVDEAEKVILKLIEKSPKDKFGNPTKIVTTSKLRNLLAMSADIYNEVLNQEGDKLNEDICARIEYLRVRFLYEAGREPSVKNLVNEAQIIDLLKRVNASKKNFILFNRYMEALVAFRKFHVTNDD